MTLLSAASYTPSPLVTALNRPIVTGPHKISSSEHSETSSHPHQQTTFDQTPPHYAYQIAIRGLPAPYYIDESGQKHLIPINRCAISNIVHQYKHLYANGDADGEREYRRKRSSGEQVQNRCTRIPFSYTINQLRSEELVISLYWTNSSRKASTTRRNKKDPPRLMTLAEIDRTMATLSEMIVYDIRAYLDEVYTSARQTGTTPDYYGIHHQ